MTRSNWSLDVTVVADMDLRNKATVGDGDGECLRADLASWILSHGIAPYKMKTNCRFGFDVSLRGICRIPFLDRKAMPGL